MLPSEEIPDKLLEELTHLRLVAEEVPKPVGPCFLVRNAFLVDQFTDVQRKAVVPHVAMYPSAIIIAAVVIIAVQKNKSAARH